MTVSAKKIRVAINGFGRIGRQFLRCWEGRAQSNIEIVCVNDSGGVKQASHLLKYDSTMGTFKADVQVSGGWCCVGWFGLERALQALVLRVSRTRASASKPPN